MVSICRAGEGRGRRRIWGGLEKAREEFARDNKDGAEKANNDVSMLRELR